MKLKTKILITSLLLILIVPSVAGAWIIGEPIVPCGNVPPGYYDGTFVGPLMPGQQPCTQCELLHLADNLIDFILIAAAPILATFFFILAGVYIMLGGAKPDMLAKGKQMFSSAMIGIIIVMLAWLMTNTLITSLVKGTLVLGNMPFNSADWWQLTCSSVGLSEQPPGGGLPPGPPPPPSPPPPPPGGCVLSNPSWAAPNGQINVGESVALVVNGQGCNGFVVSFDIYEWDPLNNDYIRTVQATVTNGVARGCHLFTSQDYIAGGNENVGENLFFEAKVFDASGNQISMISSSQIVFLFTSGSGNAC
ncbi:MAG: pilin [Candidatus Taylorbacteria bacterium]|nr:pilin [Candidatus Taylorbacteria bacterium]